MLIADTGKSEPGGKFISDIEKWMRKIHSKKQSSR
jgi:hypothetical protein